MYENFFEGKTVWLTGASSGIGKALAFEMSKAGANLIITSRKEIQLEAVRKALPFPEKCIVIPADLSVELEAQAVAQKVIQNHQVDLLFLNAGISQRSLVKDTSIDVDRKLMEVNYFASVILTKAVLPQMLARKKGHIAVISSVTGHIGAPFRSGYAASKHALHGFFESLWAENANFGINVSMIAPGYIHTNISVNALTADGSPQNSMDENTGKGMSPEVMAAKVLKGISRGKKDIFVGGKEILGIYLKRYIPALYYKIIRNYTKP